MSNPEITPLASPPLTEKWVPLWPLSTGPPPGTVLTDYRTAAFTLALADAGKFILLDSASAQVVTVPTNATVAFLVGTTITVMQWGAGQVSFAGAGGVTIQRTGPKIAAQYGAASLTKINTDIWALYGNLTA